MVREREENACRPKQGSEQINFRVYQEYGPKRLINNLRSLVTVKDQ